MLSKVKSNKPSKQQEIYHDLLSRYEKSLLALGKSTEEVDAELAEFIQYYNLFKMEEIQ